MALQSTPLSERFAFRSPTEPDGAPDGAMWINDSGGTNGNNTERYLFDAGSGTWELLQSVGPDQPSNPSAGALWKDDTGVVAVYHSGAWESLTNQQAGSGVTGVEWYLHRTSWSDGDTATGGSDHSISAGATGTVNESLASPTDWGADMVRLQYACNDPDAELRSVTVTDADGASTTVTGLTLARGVWTEVSLPSVVHSIETYSAEIYSPAGTSNARFSEVQPRAIPIPHTHPLN